MIVAGSNVFWSVVEACGDDCRAVPCGVVDAGGRARLRVERSGLPRRLEVYASYRAARLVFDPSRDRGALSCPWILLVVLVSGGRPSEDVRFVGGVHRAAGRRTGDARSSPPETPTSSAKFSASWTQRR